MDFELELAVKEGKYSASDVLRAITKSCVLLEDGLGGLALITWLNKLQGELDFVFKGLQESGYVLVKETDGGVEPSDPSPVF